MKSDAVSTAAKLSVSAKLQQQREYTEKFTENKIYAKLQRKYFVNLIWWKMSGGIRIIQKSS